MGAGRVSKYSLPGAPSACRLDRPCVYRHAHRICDNPRLNKGNSDAACFRLNNRALLPLLHKQKELDA